MDLVPLENCKTIGKILNCEILKEKLDKVSSNKNSFMLRYYHDILGSKFFSSVGYIYINYVNTSKENIYLKIDKPVYNKVSGSNYIIFPTNITNLPKLRSDDIQTRISDKLSYCFLIKHSESTPMYLVCFLDKYGNYSIGNYDGFESNAIHFNIILY